MKFLNLIVFLETNKTICAQPLRINICLKVVHDNLLVFVDNIVCLEIPDDESDMRRHGTHLRVTEFSHDEFNKLQMMHAI